MKFTPQIITGITIIVLGLVFVIIGAFLKLNHYKSGWITGNNIILLGMLIELVGLYLAASLISKNMKK